MANTHLRAKELGESAVSISNNIKALLKEIHGFRQHNTALAIDWAAQSKPAFIDEDEAGNLAGLHFTRTEMANAINSLVQLEVLLTNAGRPEQGDYLGNLEKLAKADA